MRWSLLVILFFLLTSHTGCQNFGGGSYPMQSVTRVPPPGTGSYPVQGGYYNNPMGSQSSNSPGSVPTNGAMPTTSFATANGAVPAYSQVMQAQYTEPLGGNGQSLANSMPEPAGFEAANPVFTADGMSAELPGPRAFPASSGGAPQTSNQQAAPVTTLQWQGNP